jgi:uncharacterized membrane protein
MSPKIKPTFMCAICHQEKKRHEVLSAAMVREPISQFIQDTLATWNQSHYICLNDLNRFRTQYLEAALKTEKGSLSQLEQDVLKRMDSLETVSKNANAECQQQWTIGQKIADKVADFGGSWTFIIIFFVILMGWIILNTLVLTRVHSFDPYPFIFLNLILSCLAAIQAPIIMMSQNRQEARDRLHAEHDYQVNLKAELEIRNLNSKMDFLLNDLWPHLMEIQHIQLDALATSGTQDQKE